MRTVSIAGRLVGEGHACFVIAEAGVNHNGDVKMAHRLVDIAQISGADAVKFQTFHAESVVSIRAPKAAYQRRSIGDTENQLDMVRKLELPFNVFRDLQHHAAERGILFLSSPFDDDSLNCLVEMRVPAIKIASGEITNLPFLRRVAANGLPLLLSTGMSDLNEVEIAVKTLQDAGNRNVILLQCTSSYPADPCEVNLRSMETLRNTFDLPVGYSDHTEGIEVACAAVALGACVIEKHFTVNTSLPGPDHATSVDPSGLLVLVKAIRKVESSLGSREKHPMQGEFATRLVARRSLVAACNLPMGSILRLEHLAAKRPGSGIPPSETDQVVGRRLKTSLSADDPLSWEHLE